MSTPEEVQHQPEQLRFAIGNGPDQALLQYRMVAPGAVDFYRTYTPDALRGRGLAARLVDAGLDWATRQQLQIIASCSYVAARLQARGQEPG